MLLLGGPAALFSAFTLLPTSRTYCGLDCGGEPVCGKNRQAEKKQKMCQEPKHWNGSLPTINPDFM
jgi:hypothetical protein